VSWANLDDRLHGHPKVRKLQRLGATGREAFGVWAWCLSWCRAYAPVDGKVTSDVVADAWHMTDEEAAEVFRVLLRVGLVDEELFGTYLIHDWADWQLDGQQRQSAAGKARAEKADRDAGGRFLPLAAVQPDASSDKLVKAGNQPGHATPRRTSPNPASPGRARGGQPARIDSELRRLAPWPEHKEGRA
jgi:hypothetical protein